MRGKRQGSTAGGTGVSPVPASGKPSRSFPALLLGDGDNLRKGKFVVAVSNPYAIQSDGQPTASWGIVTNLARKAPAGANLNDAPGPSQDHRTTLHHLGTLIQTDAKLGWSASGGALVNLRGQLVGITTTVASIAGHEQPAGYAIPMSTPIKRIIDTLKQGHEVEYGLLGISFGFGPVGSSDDGDERVTVQNVVPYTPAAQAGLAPGDIITHVDGRPIRDVDDIQLAVSLQPPSTIATIDYERRGTKDSAKVTLAKLPIAGMKIITNRPPAWRGIHIDYASPLLAAEVGQAATTDAFDPEGCVMVSEVEPESEAWNAGIRPGMFISHVGDERVATPDEFRAAVAKANDLLDLRLTQPLQPNTEVTKPD